MPEPQISKAGHKSHQGAISTRFSETISAERIAQFCDSIGADRSSVAPPTFLTLFRTGEFELFERMGLQLRNVLHGEQRYIYESDIHAGDQVDFQTTLTLVLEKRGSSGSMSFLTFDTEIKVSGRRIGNSRTTVIVREKKS